MKRRGTVRQDGLVASNPPALWMTFEDSAGCTWKVYVGDEKQIPQLDGHWGMTFPDTHLIAISSEIPFDRQCLTLFHEIHHSAVSNVGDPKTLSKVVGCELDETDEIEESLISFLSPKTFAILIRSGLLKFPKIPKKRLGR